MDRDFALSAQPEEYVENFSQGIPPFKFDVHDQGVATELLVGYLEKRLRTIANNSNLPLSLMLSGGVDSVLTLAAAAKAGLEVKAFTFHWASAQESMEEVLVAKNVCSIFGVEHHLLEPSDSEFRVKVLEIVRCLESSEPWEVVAGIVLSTVCDAVDSVCPGSPLISSAGADSLFMGGKHFEPSSDERSTLRQWENSVTDSIRRNFRRERFIPDFYLRIIGDEGRHFKVWQTESAVRLAGRIHPKLVRGESWDGDKECLREAAISIGIPSGLVKRAKSPMQISSGGVKAFEDLARSDLSRAYSGFTYSDPMRDDASLIIARLYLALLELQVRGAPTARG